MILGGRQKTITFSWAALWTKGYNGWSGHPGAREEALQQEHAQGSNEKTSFQTLPCPSTHYPLSQYIVPGTSPLVNSGFCAFLAKITKGGRAFPEVFAQTSTVICFFDPVTTVSW